MHWGSRWINGKELLLFFEQGDRSLLSVTVICYDSHAPVQHSFKAQSKLCPFVSVSVCTGVWVSTGQRGLDECRKVCISQPGGIRQCLL